MENRKLHFMKISATGNDFILIDNRDEQLDAKRDKAFFSKICQRRFSVGADGVILLQNSPRSDFEYIHINSDGSIAEMCGNGSRAIAYFAHTLGIVSKEMSFEINGDIYRARISGNEITTEFISPKEINLDVHIVTEPDLEEGGFIDSGVPHFIIFTKDIHSVNVRELGTKYRHHPVFQKGTNVDFVQIENENHIHVRTFERGVEDETLSCGTGAVASAIISHLRKHTVPPITTIFPGGNLTIGFKPDFTRITLTGSVTPVYKGELL